MVNIIKLSKKIRRDLCIYMLFEKSVINIAEFSPFNLTMSLFPKPNLTEV